MIEGLSADQRHEQSAIDQTLFREKLGQADGTLVPLARRSTDGKRLFIATRLVKNPAIEPNSQANPDFYHWAQDWAGKKHTGAVLVDAFAEDDEGKLKPVGHIDWWLAGDYANGGGNMHRALVPEHPHEELAVERWGQESDYTAFKVEPEYQQQGIGSLMLASSAVALPAQGVTEFYTGALLDPAKKTYEGFGLSPDDFPVGYVTRGIPIERLSDSSRVEKTIADFLGL